MLSTINNSEDNLDLLFDKGWKWKGPTRIRATLWKIAHEWETSYKLWEVLHEQFWYSVW